MTTFYFVRHGESVSNVAGEYTGHLDAPLSEQGRAQARCTAAFLQDVPFRAAYASDLCRAYETGSIIASSHGLVPVPMRQLREINGGRWEGKHYDELLAEFPESYGVWRNQIGLAAAPDGESVRQLQNRVRRCIEAIAAAHPNGCILIATHATPIRAMECVWTDTPLEKMHTIPWAGNASVTVADYDGQGHGCLRQRDIREHLAELATELPKSV